MSIVPVKAYVISNGATNSTRIIDIDFTCNGTGIANLRGVYVEAQVKSPHAFTLNLSYSVFESNRVVPKDRVFNAITDSMEFEIVTDAWDLRIDYNVGLPTGNDLTLKYGGTAGVTLEAVSKMSMEFNESTLHPNLNLDFYLI